MHNKEEKFKDLKDLKKRLIMLLSTQMDCGIEKMDTKETASVVGMIKEFAEAEKKCAEAEYYCLICKAMEEYKDNPEMMMDMARMGYNPNRSVTGRYDSRGGDHTATGWRYGYPMDDTNRDRTNRNDSDMSRPGYPYYPINGGLDPNMQPYMPENRHGKSFNEYKVWKRNYTTSKSSADKTEMDRHAMEHVHDFSETMREIWAEADPDLKRKMKTDLTKVLNELS